MTCGFYNIFIQATFKAKHLSVGELKNPGEKKKLSCVEMIDDGEDAERQCVTSQHAQTHSYQTPAARLSTLIPLTLLSTSYTHTHR